MENIQQKIKKSSKGMMIFIRILCISLIIGLCVPVFTLVYLAVNPETDFFTSGSLNFYSTTGLELKTTGAVNAEMCSLIVSGIFIFGMLLNAYNMFKSINADIKPFSQPNAKRLKKIGVILIVYSFVVPIARDGFYRTLARYMNIRSSFEISFVALALLFFFIAMIFDYGSELQRQSDETL